MQSYQCHLLCLILHGYLHQGSNLQPRHECANSTCFQDLLLLKNNGTTRHCFYDPPSQTQTNLILTRISSCLHGFTLRLRSSEWMPDILLLPHGREFIHPHSNVRLLCCIGCRNPIHISKRSQYQETPDTAAAHSVLYGFDTNWIWNLSAGVLHILCFLCLLHDHSVH